LSIAGALLGILVAKIVFWRGEGLEKNEFWGVGCVCQWRKGYGGDKNWCL